MIAWRCSGCVWEGAFASKPAPTLVLGRSYILCLAWESVGAGLLANLGYTADYQSGSHPLSTNRIIVCAAAS
ncbi:hypothetical protein PSFL6913_17990 [Pseudomonas fluorescens]|uniref:Uncharacterized protein n=2 Tax=Pseudomonas fluorescens TaxID=294 RepID=A0ABY1TF33_PSEFL|nr:hypothetical protein SAMN04488487_4145 [Pseudomonas fluorescens]SQF90621.1 Uncharacterised protein [Pseudomonas fluorescens]